MGNATHDRSQQQPPEHAISTRPAWARRSGFDQDAGEIVGISHLWTAPTVPQVSDVSGETAPLEVTVHQRDDFLLGPGGVRWQPGQPEVWIAGLDVIFPT